MANFFPTRFPTLVLAAVPLALASSACGDDGGSSSSASDLPRPTPKPAASAPAPAAAASGVASYAKVDEDLRHKFIEMDFIPDSAGETNRDPFRSWVLRPSIGKDEKNQVKKQDICTSDKVRWGAPTYSVNDLELIGLVKRGRSYAQFTDHSETDSWIVRTDDCLGREKAVIEEIGVGYVRLSITPPAPPGAPAPEAQTQDISLHPDELELPDSVTQNFEEDGS